MPSKPVQISVDVGLLKAIDRDSETRRRGRSAFMRSAVQHYLAAKRRGEIDAAIVRAYAGASQQLFDEAAGFMDTQEWPRK